MGTVYLVKDAAAVPTATVPPDYVMGTVNGEVPTYDAALDRFPFADAMGLSVVPGDEAEARAKGCHAAHYSVAEAAAFVQAKHAAGIIPFVYLTDQELGAYHVGFRDDHDLDPAGVDWLGGVGSSTATTDAGTHEVVEVPSGWAPGRDVRPERHRGFNPLEAYGLPFDDGAFAIRFLHRLCLHRDATKDDMHVWRHWLDAGGSLDQVMGTLQATPEGRKALAAERRAYGLD